MAATSTPAHFEQAVRLDAWRSVFEKTNRIISERPVTVSISQAASGYLEEIPAWTNGEAITFNGEQVLKTLKGKDSVSAVLALKGLNYHELSHVLYTPRMGDELPRMVQKRMKDHQDPDYWFAFNALEDQRIETWFTSVYGASRRYFEATVMNWIVNDATVEAAPIIYGRKYLSSLIRVGAGNVFVQKHGQALYDEMKDVIDQYIMVTLPAQSSKGYTLVCRFRELLRIMQRNSPLPSLPIPDNGCKAHSGGGVDPKDPSVMRAGRTGVRTQKVAAEAAKTAIDKAAQADADMQAQNPAPASDMPAPTDPQDAADSPGDGTDGDAQGDQGDAGDQAAQGTSDSDSDIPASPTAPSQASPVPGDGAGDQSGDITTIPDSFRQLMEAAAQGLEDIQADPSILKDVASTLDAVKASAQSTDVQVTGGDAGSGTFDASEGMKIASRRIQHILAKIRADMEPMKLRAQPNGRINVRKFMTRRPGETEIFDIWDEGSEDEASVEAVILLDCSSSMRYRMQEACGAAWALKRAFDKLEIRATALVYNTDHKVLYQPNTRARGVVPNVLSNGGTEPLSAYEQAIRVFLKSDAHNKILVNVTDGQWNSNEAVYAKVMRHVHGLGVSTMILGLDHAVAHYGKHSHKIGHDVESVSELPKAVTIWVSDILRAASVHA